MVAASQAPPVHETLADMDSHIARLKGKVEQQRKALQHWQTWDAEYEALKEQVQVLAESPTDEHLQRISADFDGELLVEKEFDDIFGHQRSRDQIVNVLDRRIDYVSQNVRSLQNQLEKAELEVLDADASNEQGAVDENGPPITEIVEELDEEGNVLSFRLNRPGEALPRVKAALEKAGIEASSPETSSEKPETTPSGANAGNSQPAKKVKESIPLPAESAQDQTAMPPVSRMAKRVDGIMKTAKEQENISSQPAIFPDDEDPDDAALRQQMLKYSMGEMGAVVAELNLEEEDDEEDDLDDDEWLEADEMDDDDDDEEEDRFGRFTGRMITDKYQRRMLELETKLGVKSRFTQKLEEKAAEKNSDDDDDDGEGIGRIRIQSQPTPPPASPATAPTKSIVKERSSTKKEPKKGVRFANDLDIANEAEPNTTLPESKSESTSAAEPLSDIIVERKPASKPVSKPTTGTPRTQRPSRFKKAAAGTQAQPGIPKGPFDVPASLFPQQHQPAERLVPTGPAGKTIADTLVSKDSVARPADPSELDDNMVHMAVAEEHHRLRSRFIRRDGGGFSNEEEGPIEPLDDTDGGGEFMSRFKAARLSRQ